MMELQLDMKLAQQLSFFNVLLRFLGRGFEISNVIIVQSDRDHMNRDRTWSKHRLQ